MNAHTHATASAPANPQAASAWHIRVLSTLDEYRACVALQREIWGEEYEEVVPASLMRAAAHVGGLTIGAFTPDGELLGFAFGVPGVQGGEAVHWSHMLGVRPGERDRGLGRALKEFQRAELAAHGVDRMYWTFDPLQARNAHLNLNRLGARVIEYVADMYGVSRSPLHLAVGTDRLVVECATRAGVDDVARASAPIVEKAPVHTPFPRPGDLVADGIEPRVAWIEVPWDLPAIIGESVARAQQWRAATRASFQRALGSGYIVTGLHRDTAAQRAYFVIERLEQQSSFPLPDVERINNPNITRL